MHEGAWLSVSYGWRATDNRVQEIFMVFLGSRASAMRHIIGRYLIEADSKSTSSEGVLLA